MSRTSYLIRYVIVSILGILLHFTYKWSGESQFIGLFSAVNESTWEHLKLLFFPLLFLTVFDYFFLRPNRPEEFLPARTRGILSGLAFIVIAFYTISGVIGQSYTFLDIAIYFIGLFIAFRTEHRHYEHFNILTDFVAVLILTIITLAFFIFTSHVPNLGIFREP
ncbi:MAG: DUF6512 family protein [Wujia sp.]